MNIEKSDKAVAEIIGVILLLAIAVTFVSTLYVNVLSDPGPTPQAEVTIVGKLDHGNIVFQHQWGEALGLDTQIILTLAGQRLNPILAGDLLSEHSKLDNVWNIGEELTYSGRDITGLEVTATVVDAESDSIILWGVLQEGYVVPPGGRGGIWHFDEPTWKGRADEVIDSSGNENHGAARNGAKINKVDAVSGNSGMFDGLNDHVNVNIKYPYSLDIREEITVDAWVKPIEFNPLLDQAGLHEKFGFTPAMIHISGDIYAVVSEDIAKGAMIQTVNISSDGEINFTNYSEILDKSTSSKNLRPEIVHVLNELYAVLYINSNSYVNIKTLSISSTGIINITSYSKIFYDSYPNPDPSEPHRPRIIKVNNNLYVVAYRNLNDQGILRTINILNSGIIVDTGYQVPFDVNPSHEPRLIHINNSLFAIAYRNNLDKGILKTFYVSSSGEIDFTGYELQFENSKAYEPSIVNISNGIFAIAYRGSAETGVLKTFNITDKGEIEYLNNEFTFETSTVGCYDPYIINYGGDIYIIAYASGTKQEGFFKTVEITSSGEISGIIDERMEFESNKCYNPYIIKITTRIFAIVYEGKDPGGAQSGHPGELKTYYIGEDPTPVELRGIVKVGAVSLYADMNYVYGSVNGPNQLLKLPINNQTWNHIAITYDRSTITLYVSYFNGINFETHTNTLSYTSPINSGENRLYFGHLFCGLIDEIAIYDHAFSESEIIAHRDNPGQL